MPVVICFACLDLEKNPHLWMDTNYIFSFYLHFVYLSGKPMISHILCYQGLAVDDYGFTLDALNLGHPRLSLN